MLEWLRFFELHQDFSQSWVAHVMDLVVVFIIIYEILKLVRDTRAVQMAAGIAVVAVLYLISQFLHLETLQFLMRNAMLYVGFGIIVLFQAEIRAALTHFGKNLRNPFSFRGSRDKKPIDSFDEIILATTTFSAQKIGALIVLERTVGLQNYINRGVRMDAILSYDLLVNIFNTNAPLHDGAVIIRNRQISAASCFLPLTLNPRLSKELGTRHRAAIGITEESDAFVIVVSEETGVISTVEQGQITRNLDSRKLRSSLSRAMDLSKTPPPPRRYRRRAIGLDVSVSPDNSMSDSSASMSDTPVSGTPVFTGSGGSPPAVVKRMRESGRMAPEAFLDLWKWSFDNLKDLFRDYVLKNGKLKIIAGIITLALWVAVSSQQDSVPFSVRGVQIIYQGLPANLVISNRESVEEVTLRIRGPRDVVERLRPESFSFRVPLEGKGPGNCVINLKEKNGDALVEKPYNIEILEVFPPRLTINLERLVTHQVTIKPSFKGDPPADYKVTNASIQPQVAVIRGPESHVYAVQNAGTETIWLTGRTASFREKYKIDVNDPRIEILSPPDQAIEVNVTVQPMMATRQITGVEIHSSLFSDIQFLPKTATVEVTGPQSVVEKLSPHDMIVSLQSPNPQTPNQFPLECTLSAQLGWGVKVTSITPPVVERVGKR